LNFSGLAFGTILAPSLTMRLFWIVAWSLCAAVVWGQPEDSPPSNVNSRYRVESVELQPGGFNTLSNSLRNRLQGLVGAPFDQASFEELGRRIRDELRSAPVQMRVVRGSAPDQVKVVFEVQLSNRTEFDVSLPRILYHSKQNFTFGLETTVRRGLHVFSGMALTDNDQLVERYSGVGAGYEVAPARRVRFKMQVASWRSQWSGVTEQAANGDLYRARQHFDPTATISISRPLTLQLGVSVERLEMLQPAAAHQLSSAANLTLRYQRRWELGPDATQGLEASYGIRSASAALGSDFVYTRHHWEARYQHRRGHSEWNGSAEAGLLVGRAPLFERFTLGNSRRLRGWNRFDLAPLGSDRYTHASLDYRFRWLRLIYDTGAGWRRNAPLVLRHSASAGVTASGITALVAFPLRNGSIEPLFLLGMNF
jgi:hypothetical protein